MSARAAFVLWDGQMFGGAETATIALVRRLAADGDEPGIVFVGTAGVYRPILTGAEVAFGELGLATGSHVLRRAADFAELVSRWGRDAAVLPSAGFLARALRSGGYRGAVVATEHGGLLQFATRSTRDKARDIVDRAIGIGTVDAQVAVSEYLRERLMRVVHAKRVEVIHNGVDVRLYREAAASRPARRDGDPTVVIGCAGKLMEGKGVEDLIAAAALIRVDAPWRIELAGEGPLREALARKAQELGVADRVRFRGWVDDMPSFWAGCDLCVAASNALVESFGMTVVEAFASGIPAIVSESGGLPEVLGESGAGASFPPGDVTALAESLSRFVGDATARAAASYAAEQRATEFDIARTASAYRALIQELARSREAT